MTAYSHRDRRAQRTVARGLATFSAVVLVLAALAMLAPGAWWGPLGVVALAASGAVYLFWSQRLVSEYARDIRVVHDGSIENGFLRAEAGSIVGLDRPVGRPSERSPHVRLRPRAGRPGDRWSDPDVR